LWGGGGEGSFFLAAGEGGRIKPSFWGGGREEKYVRFSPCKRRGKEKKIVFFFSFAGKRGKPSDVLTGKERGEEGEKVVKKSNCHQRKEGKRRVSTNFHWGGEEEKGSSMNQSSSSFPLERKKGKRRKGGLLIYSHVSGGGVIRRFPHYPAQEKGRKRKPFPS